ncbi:hypothetical protein IFT48_04770 [Pseudomonas fluorescens]|uniref:hypothetical protein n=1 Tax=Pseudomonas TaxID=286 RepID=UPI000F040DD7|nr:MULTISPECIES: hypothetical protein [Pseudomonas]MBD8089287.1 hypothetical protein [Pseudomonas fluorescens]MBD8682060.1 hypothetical protein [Pseudomonas sp. CFBP 13719]
MYQFKIDQDLAQPINAAIVQYNDLLAGRTDFFAKYGHPDAAVELNQLWNGLRPAVVEQPLFCVDLEDCLSRAQLTTMVRAFEVSVFLGDGRYCSLLDHVHPLLERHPNGFMLRQAFGLAEQTFVDMGLAKQVDPKFRELASGLRELLASMRLAACNIKQWAGPGMIIIKQQAEESCELSC